MICVTISVVAAMSLTSGSILSSFERIGYVIIGIIIALIANKFIFSFSEKDNNEEDKNIIDNNEVDNNKNVTTALK